MSKRAKKDIWGNISEEERNKISGMLRGIAVDCETELQRLNYNGEAKPLASCNCVIWLDRERSSQGDNQMRTKYNIEGVRRVSICYPDGETRVYTVVGDYVYDVTDKPGTLGRQLLDPHRHDGTMLSFRRGDGLLSVLRKCLQAAREYAARENDIDSIKL